MALIDRLLGRTPSPESVVEEYGPAVLRQLKRVFGPGADVDDAFQAVFVEILRSLPSFRGRAKIGTWVYRITLNVAYQEMRLQYKERAALSSERFDVDTLTSLDDDYARSDERRMLYAALATLPPKKRMALILHELEGYTLKEVSETLGRPLQTVASQVRSGRSELALWFRRKEEAPIPLTRRKEAQSR